VPVARFRRAAGPCDRVAGLRFVAAADALACRAAVSLLQGDGAASWADVDAIWRLGQLVARTAGPAEYGLAAGFWKMALAGTVDLAASPTTSPELLAAMQTGLGTKLGFPPATESWMFLRLAALDAAGTALVVGKPKFGAPSSGPVARPGTGAQLEALNQQFDAIDVAMQGPDPKQRLARVQAAPAAPKLIAFGRDMLGAEIEGLSAQRLAAIAVALVKAQREKGRLPASLTELGLANDRLKDPGSGGPFAYAPSGQQFRLHGVGSDGRDDGGDSAKDVVVIAREPPRPPAP
jgi:hypothetical protein